MFDEITKNEEKLANLLKDLDTNINDFPEIVEIAKGISNPDGDDAKFVKNVQEAQRCQFNINEIEVTNT